MVRVRDRVRVRVRARVGVRVGIKVRNPKSERKEKIRSQDQPFRCLLP